MSDAMESENGGLFQGDDASFSTLAGYALANGSDTDTGQKEDISMSVAEAITFSMLMSICICMTIVGNILVVLSVFTYRPLRSVQNFFIVSLAVADLAVAVLVMPFNVANFVIGKWVFGPIFCNMWLTFDILTCTASILNLCAIALDRYNAIHDPIRYAQKRTMRRVLVTITIVWVLSGLISIPPLVGWNNSAGNSLYDPDTKTCELTKEKGFVLYSASGSFYIPLVIMSFVYVNIFRATRKRLRARAQAARAAGKTTNGKDPKDPKQPATKCPSNADCGSHSSENSASPSPTHCVLCNKTSSSTAKETKNKNQYKLKKSDDDKDDADEPAKADASQQTECEMQNGQTEVTMVAPTNTLLKVPCPKSPKKKANKVNSKEKAPKSQVHQFMEEKQRISLSRERRAARTMAIIMGVFVLCWLPFFLMYIIFPYCDGCEENADHRLINFIVWLGYINSTLNPIIYTVFNIDFRRAFKILLQGKCRA